MTDRRAGRRGLRTYWACSARIGGGFLAVPLTLFFLNIPTSGVEDGDGDLFRFFDDLMLVHKAHTTKSKIFF